MSRAALPLLLLCTLALPALAEEAPGDAGDEPAASLGAEEAPTAAARCEAALAYAQVHSAPLGEPWDGDGGPLVAVEAPCEAAMLFGEREASDG